MTIYNTYQEAKIANPNSDIFHINNEFFESGCSPMRPGAKLALCNPADHCMTVEKFLAGGYKFVEGDLVLNIDGGVSTVNYSSRAKSGDDYCLEYMNYPEDGDNKRYILRAAALENQMNIDNLATQTPEEKEALDSINSDSPDFDSNFERYSQKLEDSIKDGSFGKAVKEALDSIASRTCELSKSREREFLDLIGTTPQHTNVKYEKWKFECAWHAIKAFEDGEKLYTKRSHKDYILIDNAPDVLRFLYSIYERIECDETPQQREERERLEAAKDLYTVYMSKWKFAQDWDALDDINKSAFLAIVDKTNYRKESN